jgi:cytochrome c oxidase subunit IV
VCPFHAKSDVTSHSTQVRPIERALELLVISLALSVFGILFALAAQSWTQTGCSSDCWVERALVSAVVIGGLVSLIAMVCHMRWGDGGSAARS